MARQLDKEKVKMGNIIGMANTERKHPNETMRHYALKVEDADGKNERWLLFTERQLMANTTLIFSELAETMKPGRLYKATRGRTKIRLCRVRNQYKGCEGAVFIIIITEKRLAIAEKRAQEHHEDIPTQGKLADIMD